MTKTLDILDTLTFGKHCGELLGTVIEEDPSYVQWLLDETDWRLTPEALEYLGECTK